MQHLENESVARLFKVIAKLNTAEDCRQFFDDICTIKEVLDMAQRLDVAILLRQGVNYQTISQQVNVSTATISRVSRCLNYGSGGYAAALDKLEGSK